MTMISTATLDNPAMQRELATLAERQRIAEQFPKGKPVVSHILPSCGVGVVAYTVMGQVVVRFDNAWTYIHNAAELAPFDVAAYMHDDAIAKRAAEAGVR